ncbi:MAG TPA: hypothetical protein VN803_08475 [Gemmatimonadales bacterium]|nr:hypothetical protein [Gemmatimonadales bacterium]
MTDPLLAEFAEFKRDRGPQCGIRSILERLIPEDAEKLSAALAADSIQHSQIARWLAAKGHKTSADTVRRHRCNECAC